MKIQKIKSQFVFHRGQCVGIFSLIILIVGTMTLAHYVSLRGNQEPLLEVSSEEIIALQKEFDSLRLAELEARKPKQYPFNPNFITDYKAYTLGLSPEAYDKLKAFRSKDQWINSARQFQQVTGISDSLHRQIAPWLKFPEWVSNPRPKRKSNYTSAKRKKSFSEKLDLNKATLEQLQEVYGIGPALSNRIVAYRDKIGGFANEVQLYSVWGLSEAVIERILNEFAVKNPTEIHPMNVNTATASDIATIPGISFSLAKEIWEYRRLREGVSKLEELQKIEGLTASKFKLIQLYLSVE